MFCPCGSQKPYEGCCGLYLSGKETPPSPEALMRSRYTAFTFGNLDYIEDTMRENALKRFNREAVERSLKETMWIQLTVLRATEGGDRGTVQFMVCFKQKDKKMIMHEISTFKRIKEKWYYTEGEISQEG